MAATVHRWNTYVLLSTSTQDTKMTLVKYAQAYHFTEEEKRNTHWQEMLSHPAAGYV